MIKIIFYLDIEFILIFLFNLFFILIFIIIYKYYYGMGTNDEINGDWGLGIGDWGLGIGDWGLGPIPNPQSPNFFLKLLLINYY